MRIVLSDSKKEIPVDALSRGTIEQVYLAVRIAIAAVLSDEPMFYSFDEAFAFYDEDRLAAVLCVSGQTAAAVTYFYLHDAGRGYTKEE